MKQVIQSARTGKLRVLDVPEPAARSGHALVRTTASLISAGTERMVVDFARKSLVGKAQARPDLVRKVLDKARRDGLAATLRSVRARLDEPLPLGYSAAGVIVALGDGLEGNFRVGQRVAIAGAGVANHAELNVVPRNLLAAIPHDVDDESAAFATLGAIAMHGVRNLAAGLGDIVAVVGAGLVGLLAIQLLKLSGVRVIAIDRDTARLALARRLGAELIVDAADSATVRTIAAFTAARGVDGVLIAAADDTNAPLILAAAIARDRARISLVGKIGTEFPFAEYMKKELSIVVSRSYGPGRYDSEFEEEGVKYPPGFVRWTETDNLAECLRLMAAGQERRLDVRSLITHHFPISDAEQAYDLVLERHEPHLGVVLTYPRAASIVAALPPRSRKTADRCVIGVIGAGVFSRAVLLPTLKDMPSVDLKTVVTSRGSTAEHARTAFGFAHAAAEARAIFEDPGIDAVIVATPHANHADLTAQALAAGKSVFVEKPLALDRDGLRRVVEARQASPAFFTVGFNRRFAPMAIQARARLATLPGPKLAALRINSGPPPAEGEPGGRIIGELCHFIDLTRFLVGAPIHSVHAVAAAAQTADDVAVTLSFTDGSVATIAYTGLGDSADTKERIEVFSAGTVIRIEDFRHFTVVADGRSSSSHDRIGQDKGHRTEIAAFVAAVQGKAPAPIDENELIETSLATIAVLESLRAGTPIDLQG